MSSGGGGSSGPGVVEKDYYLVTFVCCYMAASVLIGCVSLGGSTVPSGAIAHYVVACTWNICVFVRSCVCVCVCVCVPMFGYAHLCVRLCATRSLCCLREGCARLVESDQMTTSPLRAEGVCVCVSVSVCVCLCDGAVFLCPWPRQVPFLTVRSCLLPAFHCTCVLRASLRLGSAARLCSGRARRSSLGTCARSCLTRLVPLGASFSWE